MGTILVGRLGNNLKRTLQFRLRTLFWAMTIFALVMVAASQIFLWLKSVPLTNAIINFNSRSNISSGPLTIIPLSENEIDVAIESLLSKEIDNGIAESFVSSDQVRNIFECIARKRRLPRNATINLFSDNAGYTISLRVFTSARSDFVVILRKVKYGTPDAPDAPP